MTKTNEKNRKSLPKKKKVRIDYEYKENECKAQGYIVYQIPAEEIVKLREADCFGNLCDSCNQTIEDTYYIPVLNWGMCKKCFDEWKETAIFYKEDTDFEELNIHWIEKWCDRLNISMTNTTFH